MLVRDYMTSTVTTLTVEACLLDAALLIRRTGKHYVPVVSSDGKAIGIISDRDVARLVPEGASLEQRIERLRNAGSIEWSGRRLRKVKRGVRVRGRRTVADLVVANRK